MVACLALLPDRAGLAAMVSIAAAVGLPPGLAFGARVLGIEATFEAGDLLGLIRLASAATPATRVGGGPAAVGLPPGRRPSLAGALPDCSLGIALRLPPRGPA